jgi:tetratricopeptide (TPR) repeat protein
LIAGAAVALWQMFEAIAQRERAAYQQSRADTSNEFLDRLLEDVGSNNRPRTLAEVLDRSTAQIEQQYDSNERLFAPMLYEASRRYSTINKQERELALLERVAASARRLGDADLLATAQCSAAQVLVERDRAAANDRWREAVEALARASTPEASWVCVRAEAMLHEARGDIAAAKALLAATLDRRPGTAALPPNVELALLGDLGHLQHRTDDVVGSLASIQRALAILDHTGRGGSMRHAILLVNHAAILSRAGEVRAAAADQEKAMALVAQVEAGGEPPVGFANHLAASLLRLGPAERAFDLARDDARRAAAAGNVRLEASAELAAGRALIKLGRFDEAERLLGSAEARMLANPNANQRLLNEVALSRADRLLVMGRLTESRAAVMEVLGRLGYPDNVSAPGLTSALHGAVRVALAQRDWAAAERWAADAAPIAARAAIDPRRSANVGQPVYQRAAALAELGRTAEALQHAELAVAALGAGFGPDHPETIAAQMLLVSLRGRTAR